ncbi:hypothetical protein Fot_40762 [Forsythia ovata]|uniref:Uncharacterized protein n=1 Tax=Forsythia ovata TaxID=205694 RepID=A0ABD1S8E3_9LAMI
MAYSRRKWWYQCARIYNARGLPTASVLTPTARARVTGGGYAQMVGFCVRGRPHREEKRECERAAHSEEPTPNRDCESPAAAARRKWWEVQREEGPPRGDPQLDWGVHSEEEAAPQRFCVQRRCVYGVHRRRIWRSPAVAVGWGILGHEIGGKSCGRGERPKWEEGVGGVLIVLDKLSTWNFNPSQPRQISSWSHKHSP